MKRHRYQKRFEALREKYKCFTFYKQEIHIDMWGTLNVTFHFSLDDQEYFHPTMSIPARPFCSWESFPREQLETLVFHIGMVEMISYWKMACPKTVVVKPFDLKLCQKKWWRHLFYMGLGEFRYLNGIKCSEEDFVRIESGTNREFLRLSDVVFGNVTKPEFESVDRPLEEKVLVPVGGGKDSVVTLELLRDKMQVIPMMQNIRGASVDCVKTAGFDMTTEVAQIDRTLDDNMLSLMMTRSDEFLNGHTPFSALLAFESLLVAAGSGCKYIALSNESSANESTVPGTGINHQYSKSYAFEKEFREYVALHISNEIQYFSFLRPLNEMQIASLFSRFTDYHEVFRSCNAGIRTNSWCGECAKCLFTWIILSPFIPKERLKEIFRKDLSIKPELRPVFEELNGTSKVKPFDCVGTVEEVRACVDHMKDRSGTIFEDSPKADTTVEEILKRYNEENFLPAKFVDILKSNLYV